MSLNQSDKAEQRSGCCRSSAQAKSTDCILFTGRLEIKVGLFISYDKFFYNNFIFHIFSAGKCCTISHL